jgi:hypothetical protein
MTVSSPAFSQQRDPFPVSLFSVAILLSVSVLINYIDRGTLAIAAPLLKDDLGLSPSQLGI